MSCWGYACENGPCHWSKDYPIASEGQRQSPIDIETKGAVDDSETLASTPLFWAYVPENAKTIENNGHSWKVNVDGAGSTLSGGPLEDVYELWQYHAHWGRDSSQGSEHTLDGKSFAAELHLVHWNKSKYSSPNAAAAEPDGLSVLGIFIEEGDEPHKEFSKLCTLFPQIRYCGETAEVSEPVDPAKLLPSNTKEYFTYPGSLTTPPLNESVTWIVFKDPIRLSKQQLETMRQLMFCDEANSESGEHMVDNFRPPCPITGRTVRCCKH